MLGLVSQHRIYKIRPSEVLAIDDGYTAYCLDEAIAYIVAMLDDGQEPTFKTKYKSFHDLYNSYK